MDDGGSEEPRTVEMTELLSELHELEDSVDETDRAQVREVIDLAVQASQPRLFGRVIVGFDRADAAEALLGSVVFGVPMIVEGGTLEVGAFVATHSLYLLATLAFAVGIVVGIIYVADIQDVRIERPLLGVLPRRLVGVLGISFLTALILMTVWGRVDWTTPWLAFCQSAVAFVPMAIGAALGDILPGS